MQSKDFIQQPVSKNNFLKQAVIGLSDGLIIAFASATAMSVHYSETFFIWKAILLISLVIASIFGIGGYFSAKFRMESLAAKTIEEEERLQKEETKKTITLFQKLGIGRDMQEQAATEIRKDSEEWKSFLEKNQQAFETGNKKELPLTGIIIAIAFIAGSLLAVSPYLLATNVEKAFHIAVGINLPLLLLTGVMKSKVNGEPALGGGIRLLVLGTAAAAMAHFVSGIFVR